MKCSISCLRNVEPHTLKYPLGIYTVQGNLQSKFSVTTSRSLRCLQLLDGACLNGLPDASEILFVMFLCWLQMKRIADLEEETSTIPATQSSKQDLMAAHVFAQF